MLGTETIEEFVRGRGECVRGLETGDPGEDKDRSSSSITIDGCLRLVMGIIPLSRLLELATATGGLGRGRPVKRSSDLMDDIVSDLSSVACIGTGGLGCISVVQVRRGDGKGRLEGALGLCEGIEDGGRALVDAILGLVYRGGLMTVGLGSGRVEPIRLSSLAFLLS
jgi:hypothetical protein